MNKYNLKNRTYESYKSIVDFEKDWCLDFSSDWLIEWNNLTNIQKQVLDCKLKACEYTWIVEESTLIEIDNRLYLLCGFERETVDSFLERVNLHLLDSLKTIDNIITTLNKYDNVIKIFHQDCKAFTELYFYNGDDYTTNENESIKLCWCDKEY